nr:hypothetical protein [Actinomadura madurae]
MASVTPGEPLAHATSACAPESRTCVNSGLKSDAVVSYVSSLTIWTPNCPACSFMPAKPALA